MAYVKTTNKQRKLDARLKVKYPDGDQMVLDHEGKPAHKLCPNCLSRADKRRRARRKN